MTGPLRGRPYVVSPGSRSAGGEFADLPAQMDRPPELTVFFDYPGGYAAMWANATARAQPARRRPAVLAPAVLASHHRDHVAAHGRSPARAAAAAAVATATRVWTRQADEYLITHRHNVITVIPVGGLNEFRGRAARYRQAGVRVAATIVVVPPALQQLAALEDYAAEHARVRQAGGDPAQIPLPHADAHEKHTAALRELAQIIDDGRPVHGVRIIDATATAVENWSTNAHDTTPDSLAAPAPWAVTGPDGRGGVAAAVDAALRTSLTREQLGGVVGRLRELYADHPPLRWQINQIAEDLSHQARATGQETRSADRPTHRPTAGQHPTPGRTQHRPRHGAAERQ